MLPDQGLFESELSLLGISQHNVIVVYDSAGLGAARVYWMFRVFGHEQVSVLDGGLNAWIEAGGETVAEEESFKASLRVLWLTDRPLSTKLATMIFMWLIMSLYKLRC